MKIGLARVMRIDFYSSVERGKPTEQLDWWRSPPPISPYQLIGYIGDLPSRSRSCDLLPVPVQDHNRFERILAFTEECTPLVHALIVIADLSAKGLKELLKQKETKPYAFAQELEEDLWQITLRAQSFYKLPTQINKDSKKYAPLVFYIEPEQDIVSSHPDLVTELAKELKEDLHFHGGFLRCLFCACDCLFVPSLVAGKSFPFEGLTIVNLQALRYRVTAQDTVLLPEEFFDLLPLLSAYHQSRYRYDDLELQGFDRHRCTKYLELPTKHLTSDKRVGIDEAVQLHEAFITDLKKWAYLSPLITDELREFRKVVDQQLAQWEKYQAMYPYVFFDIYIPTKSKYEAEQIPFIQTCKSELADNSSRLEELLDRVHRENDILSGYIQGLFEQRLETTNLKLQKRMEWLTWIMLLLTIVTLLDNPLILWIVKYLLQIVGLDGPVEILH
jgi:hypothetical protein